MWPVTWVKTGLRVPKWSRRLFHSQSTLDFINISSSKTDKNKWLFLTDILPKIKDGNIFVSFFKLWQYYFCYCTKNLVIHFEMLFPYINTVSLKSLGFFSVLEYYSLTSQSKRDYWRTEKVKYKSIRKCIHIYGCLFILWKIIDGAFVVFSCWIEIRLPNHCVLSVFPPMLISKKSNVDSQGM